MGHQPDASRYDRMPHRRSGPTSGRVFRHLLPGHNLADLPERPEHPDRARERYGAEDWTTPPSDDV